MICRCPSGMLDCGNVWVVFARGLAVRHLLLLGKLLGNMSHSGTLCGLGSTRGSSCLGIHLRVV